jgi:hypothetical protein
MSGEPCQACGRSSATGHAWVVRVCLAVADLVAAHNTAAHNTAAHNTAAHAVVGHGQCLGGRRSTNVVLCCRQWHELALLLCRALRLQAPPDCAQILKTH